jgi:Amt family ammonium transporter
VFIVTYLIARLINRYFPMRVTPQQEHIGLNISEHGASTELVDLFMVMDTQAKTGDLSLRVPVEPFTEVGQIASRYNQMMDSLEGAIARTQIIVRSAMDAIITLSEQTLQVSTVNPAAETMFGVQDAAITGQPITHLLHSHLPQDNGAPSTLAQLQTWLAEAATSGHPQEIVGKREDGSEFPIEATVAEAEFGDEIVYVGTMRDITIRKQAEAELAQYRKHLEDQVAARTFELTQTNQSLEHAKDEAETANRAKSAFMLNISHELITPMNAILGYSEMLAEDAEDEGYDKIVPDLEKINSSGLRLLSLINGLLDLSKIDAGQMDLSLERFDLSPMLNEIVSTVTPVITENGNELVTEFSAELGSMSADLGKVRQALFNVLSNAAKFTKGGTITLAAKREPRPDGDWIIMHISDTGIGITEEKIDYIFEAFTQADESTTRIYGGTGLGLSVSRRFCRMMGGDILVESQVSVGSTFTIELPAEVKAATAAKDTA